MSLKPNVEQYGVAATEIHGSTVCVQPGASVSYGDDPGAYVKAFLEFGIDPEKTDDDWRNHAREEYGRDGELEVDEEPVTYVEGTAIVAVWVWVDEEDAFAAITTPPTPGVGTELQAGLAYRCPDCSAIKIHTRETHRKGKGNSIILTCGACNLSMIAKGNTIETLEPSTDVDPSGDSNEHGTA